MVMKSLEVEEGHPVAVPQGQRQVRLQAGEGAEAPVDERDPPLLRGQAQPR